MFTMLLEGRGLSESCGSTNVRTQSAGPALISNLNFVPHADQPLREAGAHAHWHRVPWHDRGGAHSVFVCLFARLFVPWHGRGGAHSICVVFVCLLACLLVFCLHLERVPWHDRGGARSVFVGLLACLCSICVVCVREDHGTSMHQHAPSVWCLFACLFVPWHDRGGTRFICVVLACLFV